MASTPEPDILPPDSGLVSPEQIADMASELKEMGMSPDFIKLVERGIHSTRLPKALRNQKAAQAMQSAFEIIGGVPRLALWADANPDKFYPLFARMIPTTAAPVIADLPQTHQQKRDDWPTWLTNRRLAYQESQETASDVHIKTLDSDI